MGWLAAPEVQTIIILVQLGSVWANIVLEKGLRVPYLYLLATASDLRHCTQLDHRRPQSLPRQWHTSSNMTVPFNNATPYVLMDANYIQTSTPNFPQFEFFFFIILPVSGKKECFTLFAFLDFFYRFIYFACKNLYHIHKSCFKIISCSQLCWNILSLLCQGCWFQWRNITLTVVDFVFMLAFCHLDLND